MGLTAAQYEALQAPLSSSRVATRKQGTSGPTLSYLEAWDVKAHLTRIFGYGGWSADVVAHGLVFEQEPQGNSKNWNVAYRVTMRLTVHSMGPHSQDVTYTEVAVGGAQLPSRWEAHDMAVKTAESDAIKRCAINLGTQFGLSLYDNGSKKDVVGPTLAPPPGVVILSAADKALDAEGLIDAATTEAELKALWDAAQDGGYLTLVSERIKARLVSVRGEGDAA